MKTIPVLLLSALALTACGSSGGTSTPPAPPPPVAPPPPPPEPTFEERLADLAEFDPNPCRAETPGFEALGGWLKNDGRDLGGSRVWIVDVGALDQPLSESHGARVWASFTACAARSTEDQYHSSGALHWESIRADGGDGIKSISSAPFWEDIDLPEPGIWDEYPYVRPGILDRAHDGNRDGQRLLRLAAAGNDNGKRTSWLQDAGFQLALQESSTALVVLVGGYSGEGDNRAPAADIPARTSSGLTGSSLCGAADALCLFAPWRAEGRDDTATKVGTSHSTPQVAAALDTVWAVWPDMDILDLRNLAFDCAENMAAPAGETATTRSYSYKNGRSFTSDTNSTWGHGILSLTCLFTPNGGLQNPVTGNSISGGIFGPVAGPITGASITGVDYTGRDFGYGFAYPVARENFALLATAAVQPSIEFSAITP